jgi:hypothetical protein
MNIRIDERVQGDEERLGYIWAVGRKALVRLPAGWNIEVFPLIKEHIDVFREKISKAMDDPMIIVAGILLKEEDGNYSIDMEHGAPTLEREGICTHNELVPGIGPGVEIAFVLQKSEIVENAINAQMAICRQAKDL